MNASACRKTVLRSRAAGALDKELDALQQQVHPSTPSCVVTLSNVQQEPCLHATLDGEFSENARRHLGSIAFEIVMQDMIGAKENVHSVRAVQLAKLAFENQAIKTLQHASDKYRKRCRKVFTGVSFLREMAVDSPPFHRKEHPFKSFSRGGLPR